MSIGTLVDLKTIQTRDLDGIVNGSIVELYKDNDKTIAYITTIMPGTFKGYHLHRIRKGQYVCIKGKVKVTLYKPGTKKNEEFVLSSEKPQRLFIPTNIAAGIESIGTEEAWIINYTDPPYDPALKDEQVEYTREELEGGIIK